nr:uncharacterized protein LOC108072643 [Drosophila kikkawai]
MIKKKIILTSDCCCSEPTTPEQVSLARNRDSVTEIFAECGKKLGNRARQVIDLAKKRNQEFHCRTSSISKIKPLKRKPIHPPSFWKRLTFDDLATGVLILMILLILVLVLFLVRSYNLAHAYGTGGCLWPMFWGQCQIMT